LADTILFVTIAKAKPKEKSMSLADTPKDINRELARRINQDARSNPQSPYANKFVGIANGQVVAVADDLDEMTRQLRQAEADPGKCFWVEASRDYDEVHQIWELT
jgi:hypothetical protein